MLKLNRKTFFARVRRDPFPGKLTARQVEGMNDLLDVWEEYGTADTRHLAYCLATDFHETGSKMQPVREGFKTSDKAARVWVQRHYGHKGEDWYCWPQGPHGHVYYGRGDVQLTWYENYVKMGEILGLPLAEKPDLVLQSKVSKRILVEGMLDGVSKDGDFTGKSLEDYFNTRTDDPVNARRIVNGRDRAEQIAHYHDSFLEAVEAAEETSPDDVDDENVAAPTLPAATDPASWGAGITGVGGIGAIVVSVAEKLNGPIAILALGMIVGGLVVFAMGRRRIVAETGE